MNRALIFGIAIFIAVVGIALLGSDNTAQAGHRMGGCHGYCGGCYGDCGGCDGYCHCGGRRMGMRRHRRCHGCNGCHGCYGCNGCHGGYCHGGYDCGGYDCGGHDGSGHGGPAGGGGDLAPPVEPPAPPADAPAAPASLRAPFGFRTVHFSR